MPMSDRMTTSASSKHVILTLDAFESLANIVQTVCEAVKHSSNPVLPLGRVDEWDATQARPWEARTVLFDDDAGRFKCWYAGTDASTKRWWATGYAESEDGVHWVKPRIGLFEYNGSKDNNIVRGAWGPIIKDDGEPDAQRRYKMIVKGPGSPDSVERLPNRVAYSPDGIHWTDGPHLALPAWNGRNPDPVALIKDDQDPDPRRRYKLVWQDTQKANKPGPERVRVKCMAFGENVEHWTASSDNPFLAPNDGLEFENHFLMMAPYAGCWVLPYEYGWYTPNGQGTHGQYAADIRLAVSRDGEHFDRLNPHQKLIRRGSRGAWDSQFLVISDKPVIRGDKIYLYYCGQGEDWTGWPSPPPKFAFGSTGSIRLSRMGLATLRRDGWFCLETTDRELSGTATTRPIDANDPDVNLAANVSHTQSARSWVEVEVLDAQTNEVIDGFSRDDCVKLERDSVSQPVLWRNKKLADVGVARIKLRFGLIGAARLYAFSFERT